MKTCCICGLPMTGTMRQRAKAHKVHPKLKCRELGIEHRIEDVVQNLLKGSIK